MVEEVAGQIAEALELPIRMFLKSLKSLNVRPGLKLTMMKVPLDFNLRPSL